MKAAILALLLLTVSIVAQAQTITIDGVEFQTYRLEISQIMSDTECLAETRTGRRVHVELITTASMADDSVIEIPVRETGTTYSYTTVLGAKATIEKFVGFTPDESKKVAEYFKKRNEFMWAIPARKWKDEKGRVIFRKGKIAGNKETFVGLTPLILAQDGKRESILYDKLSKADRKFLDEQSAIFVESVKDLGVTVDYGG